MRSNQFVVKLWRKGSEARCVKLHAGSKETVGATKQNDAYIQVLSTLNTRHNANNCIVIGAERGHAEPPLQRCVTRSSGRAGRPHRLPDAQQVSDRAGLAAIAAG